MINTESLSFRNIVEQSQKDDAGLNYLLEIISPVLNGMARKHFPAIADDAFQNALIMIWKKIGKVDTSRTDGEIRGYLIQTGYRAMQDTWRKFARQNTESHVEDEDQLQQAKLTQEYAEEATIEFSGLLQDYLEYVDQTGDISGAHTAIARKNDCSIAKQTREFHKAAREFTGQSDIAPAMSRYSDVVKRVLEIGPKAPVGIYSQLKRAITESGLSYREIARRAGISHSTINLFMKNRRVVSAETIDKIFFALGYELKPRKL